MNFEAISLSETPKCRFLGVAEYDILKASIGVYRCFYVINCYILVILTPGSIFLAI